MHGTADVTGLARPEEPTPLRLTWLHPTGLVGLSFVNFLLRVLTLGIYGFWAKTEVRKRLWSAIRIEGEPLQYTGTGKELFLGFLVAFGVVVLPIMLVSIAVNLAFGPDSLASNVFILLLYPAMFTLIGIAIYRAQRYRLSRTTWRGIRGALVGSDRAYGWKYFWTALLLPMTLGWIAPWRTTELQAMLTRDMRFGNRPFRFTADSGSLYGRFAVFWCGALVIVLLGALAATSLLGAEIQRFESLDSGDFQPSLRFFVLLYAIIFVGGLFYALVGAWYRAGMLNHFAANTHFEGATFKANITAGGLIWLSLTNLFIIVLTLGLLSPVAQARASRYMIEHMSIEGTVPLGEIAQGADQGITRGEGLAQAFDVDIGAF